MSVSISGPRAGNLTAWHAPEAADERWYPVTGCKLAAGVPVRVMLDKPGFDVLAVIKKHPRRKVWWWFQLGVWSGDEARWLRSQEIALAPVGADPRWDTSPNSFRPVDEAAWPYALPAPLDPPLGPKRPPAALPAAPEPLDPHHGSDDWPYPGLALGRLTAPRSREECEARVLRAYRTSAAQPRTGHGGSSLCADIPKEIVLASVRLNEAWWSVHPDADGGVFEAVRSGWTPTERDIADWWVALGWLNHVEPKARRAVALRAADPPWSFRQIAERLGVMSHNTARALYGRAIDHAFGAAAGNWQQAGGGEG